MARTKKTETPVVSENTPKARRTRTPKAKVGKEIKPVAEVVVKAKVGRPSKDAKVKKEANSEVQKSKNKSVEALYNQLDNLMRKQKITKGDLAKKLDMSYQGLLNSYSNRNIRLEGWYAISELFNKTFVARFESPKNAEAILAAANSDVSEAPSAATSHVATPVAESNDFASLRLRNSEDKVAILERQIASLESQLADKQFIINLLQNK